MNREEEDKLAREGSKDGVLLLRSLHLVSENGGEKSFPAKAIWKPWVPPNMCFFNWEASWGKVLTLNQVKQKGRPLANRFVLC